MLTSLYGCYWWPAIDFCRFSTLLNKRLFLLLFFQEYAPPNEEMVAKARARKLKELSMYSIIRENMFHLFFVLVLVGISYGARDTRAYVQSKVVEDAFSTQVGKTAATRL